MFPGTKIVVSSGTLKQANEVLLKIQDDFMKQSPILCSEIEKCSIGQNDATIMFRNTSWIKTRVSNENSRSARANILICDEYRMVDEGILNSVLRKFLTSPRQPKYLSRPEYKHLKERNKEIYMSSAYFKGSWAYKKAQDYVLNFFDDKKKYFICALPYQMSIYENLLSREQIEDEMSENSFSDIMFKMEMECLWYGDSDGNLFKFDEIQKRRRIKTALMPLDFYTDKLIVPNVPTFGKRILSVDVALMQSSRNKNNDAASLYINDLILVDDLHYQSNFIYGKPYEGLTTDELGIIIMRYFYKYKCTDLVVDTNGLGIGVADFIMKDQYDSETGEVYKAFTCINDKDMAARCKVQDANKVLWCIKANATFNNEICILLRNGIQNGKINFLISEQEAENQMKDIYKGYTKLPINKQTELRLPYIETTMAEYELVKLEHEIKNGQIKVKEISGMRKDRYSSIAYNYWVACQLELKLKPKKEETRSKITMLTARAPRKVTRY